MTDENRAGEINRSTVMADQDAIKNVKGRVAAMVEAEAAKIERFLSDTT
jgi:hypothetical protein